MDSNLEVGSLLDAVILVVEGTMLRREKNRSAERLVGFMEQSRLYNGH